MREMKIGPGSTGLDPEVAKLVWAMNRLPGIETRESCCGHGKRPFHIWFSVTDYEARGLLTISRLLSWNYYGFWRQFRVVLDHSDTDPQVCFLLESKTDSDPEIYRVADEMAAEIDAHVDDTVKHYNILTDRSKGRCAPCKVDVVE